MPKCVSPESVGISSKAVMKFLKILEDHHLCTHSLLLARGNEVFCEKYYAPFNAQFKHRMYSVSKSFVSVAIGLLIEDGKLSLDDPFISFFPEYTKGMNDPWFEEMTVRDALRMATCTPAMPDWFTCGTTDRTKVYFQGGSTMIPGTRFMYDSPGSYMLGVIVENITGKPFLKFLQERFLDAIGFSKDAYCIQCPGGHSFADSGVMCTTRDLWRFARFVMNGGTWNGVRYMDETYLREAASYQIANNPNDIDHYGGYGYGYQIWQAPRGGFAFIGMGDQFAICDPKTDTIFIINSDNQGNPWARTVIYQALYTCIIEEMGDPLPEDAQAYEALCAHEKNGNLRALDCCSTSPFAAELTGRTYRLNENPMGISWIRFESDGDRGVLHYENARGVKAIPFGFGYNVFGKFPEEGYADLVATVSEPGHRYDCAVSAEWVEKQKLHIAVQIIDKYFGNCHMTFSFKDDRVVVSMQKAAEAFLDGYQGTTIGVWEK